MPQSRIAICLNEEMNGSGLFLCIWSCNGPQISAFTLPLIQLCESSRQ
jgi:hypothetical protein